MRDPELLTQTEATRQYNISPRKLSQFERDGLLMSYRTPRDGRKRLYRRADLDAIERTVTPATAVVTARGAA